MNVVASAIFVVALAAMAVNILYQTRRSRQAKGTT